MSNPTTQSLDLQNGALAFEGAVSIQPTDSGIRPLRLPVAELDLFPFKAHNPVGVRLTFRSDTSAVTLRVAPDLAAAEKLARRGKTWVFDLLVDGELHQRVAPPLDADTIAFTDLPAGEHLLELYLPCQSIAVVVRQLLVDAGARVEGWADGRPRMVFYGSSVTQSGARKNLGPSETWPSLVARRFGLHHTNLGYGGQCHMDPMVGRMIRDMPADYIGLKLALCMVVHSVPDRTFLSLAIGLIKTIRDGHPDTPMAVVSPICCPDIETENDMGMTTMRMRELVAEACDRLRGQGDTNLHYVDGLSLMGAEEAQRYIDDDDEGAHPGPEGYRFLAQAYGDKVMPLLGLSD